MEEVKARLQEELSTLEEELHFKLPKEIQKAREFGDLRENAEYKAAIERQSMVKARIRQIQDRLSEVQSIDISKIPTDRIAYGSKVVLVRSRKGRKSDLPASNVGGKCARGRQDLDRFTDRPGADGAKRGR